MKDHYTTDNDFCRNFLRFNLVEVNKHLFKNRLEQQWETSLQIYTKLVQKFRQIKDTDLLYLSQISTPSNYNYLIVAQINHVLSYKKNIQCLIRKLSRKEFQLQYKEHFLSHKPHKQSLFVRWCLRLWHVEFSKYMNQYTIYLRFFNPLIFQNSKMQYLENKICLSNEDLLVMQLSFYRGQQWYNHLGSFSKEKRNFAEFFDRYTVKYISNNCPNVLKSLDKKEFIRSKDICLIKEKWHLTNQDNILLRKEYIYILKYLVKINKSNTQKNLIQQVNTCIRYQNRFFSKNSHQNNSKIFNAAIRKLLYSWGIDRHNNHSVRWCKKRYWYYFEDGIYFSTF